MLLRWLISTIGVTTLKGELSAIMKRAGRRVLLGAIGLLLWLTALGFALATFVIWLATELGAIAACGIIAASLAVLGLAIQIVLTVSSSRRKKAKSPLADLAAGINDGFGTSGGSLGSMVVVALAGYLLGRHISRR